MPAPFLLICRSWVQVPTVSMRREGQIFACAGCAGGLPFVQGGLPIANPCTVARRRFYTPSGFFLSGKGGEVWLMYPHSPTCKPLLHSWLNEEVRRKFVMYQRYSSSCWNREADSPKRSVKTTSNTMDIMYKNVRNALVLIWIRLRWCFPNWRHWCAS